jgi:ribosomal-protein-alanine N-acetyltransferase
MENKITQEYIGEIGYTVKKNRPFGKIVDLGYFTKEKYWHKGYTTEAVKRIIEYAFKENHVYKITTGCLKDRRAYRL